MRRSHAPHLIQATLKRRRYGYLNAEVMIILSQAAMYGIVVPLLFVMCLLAAAANMYILIAARFMACALNTQLLFTLSLCLADVWMCILMAFSFLIQSYLPFVHDIKLPYTFCIGLSYESFRTGQMTFFLYFRMEERFRCNDHGCVTFTRTVNQSIQRHLSTVKTIPVDGRVKK